MSFDSSIPFDRAAHSLANPLGIHAGVWVNDWSATSARAAIEESARAGFDLIEIPLPDSTGTAGATAGSALTRALLDDNGLDAVVSLALGVDTDINIDNARVSARGEQKLLDAVAFAQEIGAHYVGGVTFSAMTKYLHPATEASRANSLAVLTRVAAFAHEADVRIGLEYVNRYESNLLNTAAQTAAFIGDLKERGAANVLLHIDTYHANIEELSQADAVRDAGALLGYMHIAENHRGRLGTGSIDWPGLFGALASSGYKGPLTFESFSSSIVSTATCDNIGLWRNPWNDPIEVARHAAAFLREQRAASADRIVASTAASC
ncbi:sugar phosphate isomerase/epimerase family protein [Arthrobacter sp. NPDC058127]|uniref:sugar phosphate isomerase/epimerase family protein n=1 Tax=Arthrobacter sp. NPDC058127 TaxID=3346351 RepID=UPI0036F053CB